MISVESGTYNFAHPSRLVRRTRLFKVRQINATGALSALAARLSPPQAVVGNRSNKIAKWDLGAQISQL